MSATPCSRYSENSIKNDFSDYLDHVCPECGDIYVLAKGRPCQQAGVAKKKDYMIK